MMEADDRWEKIFLSSRLSKLTDISVLQKTEMFSLGRLFLENKQQQLVKMPSKHPTIQSSRSHKTLVKILILLVNI